MKKIKIHGGIRLKGSFNVNGSKNAALPMIFATVASYGISEISNFPFIGDTETALEIISDFGATFKRVGKSVFIDTRNLSYRPPKVELVRKIRASTYLIGACLSRFGRIDLSDFGGCNFSDRPIDIHIYSAQTMGANLVGNSLVASRISANVVNLPKPSVGATVNSLILASGASGVTEIRGAAKEPHVNSLIDYLSSMGAKIERIQDCIKVTGAPLGSGKSRVIGDMIEAATYLLAGVLTGGEVSAVGVEANTLYPLLSMLCEMGAEVNTSDIRIKITGKSKLKYAKAVAKPYPELPTDIQPLLAPLFAKNSGGYIKDCVFPDRFGYLNELSRFGINWYREEDGVVILPSRIHRANVIAPDLRGGASCLLTALCTHGESVINSAETLLRGYESPDALLRSLGAKIKIEED